MTLASHAACYHYAQLVLRDKGTSHVVVLPRYLDSTGPLL